MADTDSDVPLVRIVELADQYQRATLGLADMARNNTPAEDRLPVYQELIDTAWDLARALEAQSTYYQGKAESWRQGLARLRRYT